MADTNEALTTWSRLWDSCSSVERWVLAGALLVTHAAAFGGGMWLIYERSQNQIAATEAKYERQITDLQSQIVQAQSAPAKVIGYDITIGIPLDSVPQLADAPFDETGFQEFARAYWSHVDAHREQTDLQTPDFYKLHAGTRYRWAGYVSNVADGGSEELRVTIADRVEYTQEEHKTNSAYDTFVSTPRMFTVSCYFEKKAEAVEPIRNLQRGQWVELTGVLDNSGDLRRCKLLKTKPKENAPDWLTGPMHFPGS